MFSKLNQHLAHYLNRLVVLALALLGFASCSSDDEEDEPYLMMYGTPYSSYEIKGKVVNSNNTPVGDAIVIVKEGYYNNEFFYPRDTVKVESNGDYKTVGSIFPGKTLRLVAVDQTTQQRDSVEVVTDPKIDSNNTDPWYGGRFEAEVNIVIKNQNK